MKPLNENPLIPPSWTADGMQGADAKAQGSINAQHSATEVSGSVRARARERWHSKLSTRSQATLETDALFLVLVALDAAREQLNRCALLTDEPEPGTVEAADLLDVAQEMLARGSSP